MLSALVLLSGCATTPVATVDPFRTALRDVCISSQDQLSEPTAQQIEANNLALRRMLSRGSQCPRAKGGAAPAPAKAAPPKEDPRTS